LKPPHEGGEQDKTSKAAGHTSQ